jgi:hypothetical protein
MQINIIYKQISHWKTPPRAKRRTSSRFRFETGAVAPHFTPWSMMSRYQFSAITTSLDDIEVPLWLDFQFQLLDELVPFSNFTKPCILKQLKSERNKKPNYSPVSHFLKPNVEQI